jgi:hypothetical protein
MSSALGFIRGPCGSIAAEPCALPLPTNVKICGVIDKCTMVQLEIGTVVVKQTVAPFECVIDWGAPLTKVTSGTQCEKFYFEENVKPTAAIRVTFCRRTDRSCSLDCGVCRSTNKVTQFFINGVSYKNEIEAAIGQALVPASSCSFVGCAPGSLCCSTEAVDDVPASFTTLDAIPQGAVIQIANIGNPQLIVQVS